MWEMKNPKYGDQIRVNRGFYYHHGIYENDDRVYHFASPIGSEVNPQNAKVIVTTLKDFLKGGNVEVRSYTADELKIKKSPQEIIEYAKKHLGEGGYDLITNNCEHFSNRCAFGQSISNQVDEVFSLLGGLFYENRR